MSIDYKTNGNLALKPLHKQRPVRLHVVSPRQKVVNAFDQIADQVFSDEANAFCSKSVGKALGNLAGSPVLRTRQERTFAAFASVIACVALFYFSFFAF